MIILDTPDFKVHGIEHGVMVIYKPTQLRLILEGGQIDLFLPYHRDSESRYPFGNDSLISTLFEMLSHRNTPSKEPTT